MPGVPKEEQRPTSIRHLAAGGLSSTATWLSRVVARMAVAAGDRPSPDAGSGLVAQEEPTASARRRASSGSKYSDAWQPSSPLEARRLITIIDDEEYFERTGQEEADRLLPWVVPGSTVLDLGCGIGRIARYVAPHCRTLWAVDVSEPMLALAAEHLEGLTNVRFARVADTTVPDVPDGSIDFVYSVLVLQHLEREDAFCLMEDVARMLRPGAAAFVTWPNVTDPFYLDGFVTYARNGEVANPSRARMYTAMELETILPAAGFTKVEVYDAPNIVTICVR